jgi:SAM-dependent methyltransferase
VTSTAPAAPTAALPYTPNRMHPLRWVPKEARSLLDVGCNGGDLLADVRVMMPWLELAGVDVNAEALAIARKRLPDVELHETGAESLPFADARFDVATCIEVLEHVPAELRRPALAEIHRVLAPNGLLLLRVPHAGSTEWLDSNNLRFRFPRLYRRLLGRGMRDAGYEGGTEDVVWHHHFSVPELLELAGPQWEVERIERGGLILYPVADILAWPFYRTRRIHNPAFRALQRVADFDLGVNYGAASFDVLLLLRKR